MNSVNPQENRIKINNLNINYKIIGKGDTPIILLHGWGVDSDKYVETVKSFKGFNYKIIIPDLPGFGKSDEPEENWNLDNYVEFVNEFIVNTVRREKGLGFVKNILSNLGPKKLVFTENKRRIVLIGHSFGGRIAVKYAVKYPGKIEKLILTGSAGIKHPFNIKQKAIFILAKIGKKVFSLLKEARLPIGGLASFSRKFLYKAAKEKDYYKASPKMKEIMKKVIAENLTVVLEKINIPTLLVWGSDDMTTPLSDGKIMNEKIKDSELIAVDGANHSLPYQKPEEFAKIVTEFI